jgi:acyl carrier protein phosphodiesterase
MIQNDWLCSYAELTTIEYVLTRMAKRFKRPTPIAASYSEILTHYAALESGFLSFFPDLIEYCQTLQKGDVA